MVLKRKMPQTHLAHFYPFLKNTSHTGGQQFLSSSNRYLKESMLVLGKYEPNQIQMFRIVYGRTAL